MMGMGKFGLLAAAAVAMTFAPGCGSRKVSTAATTPASEEAPTACPDERMLATRARESALDMGGSWQTAVGSAVLLHARCEHRAFLAMELDADSEDELMEQFARARHQFHTARNLYGELMASPDPRIRKQAEVALEELYEAFSTKLREAEVMQDELGEVAFYLDQQSKRAWR